MPVKLVVSDPKSKRAFQKEVEEANLLGKKLGEKISGEAFGLTGYEIEVTGGSDKDGFPMRKDLPGTARKRLVLTAGTGFHPKRKGQRKRKSVRGNTISQDIAQVNAKVVKAGAKAINELWGVELKPTKKEQKAAAKEKPKEEAKPAETKEAPKEEKKTEPAKEAPKEEAKTEKPAETKPEEKKEPEVKPAEEKPKEEPKPEEKPAESKPEVKEEKAEAKPEEKKEEKKD